MNVGPGNLSGGPALLEHSPSGQTNLGRCDVLRNQFGPVSRPTSLHQMPVQNHLAKMALSYMIAATSEEKRHKACGERGQPGTDVGPARVTESQVQPHPHDHVVAKDATDLRNMFGFHVISPFLESVFSPVFQVLFL